MSISNPPNQPISHLSFGYKYWKYWQWVTVFAPIVVKTWIQLLFLSTTLVLLSGCNYLPDQPHITSSVTLDKRLDQIYNNELEDEQSKLPPALNKSIAQQKADHPNKSAYHTVVTGANAFAGRSILTDMATTSIDVQYYIWHNDQAGQLLLQDLWQAAERGVIVRFLLDDFNSSPQLDQHLLRFASHPNIAVRLANPMAHRKLQALNYITNFRRINHRMHNKSMTFDRQISMLGGRNIGDEYLSNDKVSQFADLDVLLIGDVVDDISTSFEGYWTSNATFDIQTLVSPNDSLVNSNSAKDPSIPINLSQPLNSDHTQKYDFISYLDKLASYETVTSQSKDGQPNIKTTSHLSDLNQKYKQAVRSSTIGVDLINKKVPFKWVDISLLSDPVEKLDSVQQTDTILVNQLRERLGVPTKKLTIISSYFVPSEEGVDDLVTLAKQGVQIKILTNSFKATDVTAVHSGYAHWRKTLLKAGIEIYELKALASEEDRENRLWKAHSQSATSLHAKAFAVDDTQVFIGSYNIDPRSANINTEIGVLIDDPQLADRVHNAISDKLLSQAFKVTLSKDGSLQWQTLEAVDTVEQPNNLADGSSTDMVHEQNNEKLVTYLNEPDVEFSDALWINVMAILPIDWLL